jgi:hypothetical protein
MSAQAGVPYQYVTIPLLRIRDDGIYHFKCPKGHDSTVRLINLKFELLVYSDQSDQLFRSNPTVYRSEATMV